MSNAKLEFLKHIDGRAVKCAKIYGDEYSYGNVPTAILKVGHSQSEFEDFIGCLEFEYDSGYGGQELFGHIWYQDGTWSGRGEYDGSEWWEHNVCPTIPPELAAP